MPLIALESLIGQAGDCVVRLAASKIDRLVVPCAPIDDTVTQRFIQLWGMLKVVQINAKRGLGEA